VDTVIDNYEPYLGLKIVFVETNLKNKPMSENVPITNWSEDDAS
jgi:hypothetical protein